MIAKQASSVTVNCENQQQIRSTKTNFPILLFASPWNGDKDGVRAQTKRWERD
jgi:hypothetical protein